jgi:hypothetical protein
MVVPEKSLAWKASRYERERYHPEVAMTISDGLL